VNAMDAVLVINAGSSSLKFQVFGIGGQDADLNCIVKGQMDGVGTRPRLRATGSDKTALIDQTYPAEKIPDLPAAIQETGDWLRRSQKVNLVAVGHRVVHGGPNYDSPVRVTEGVVAQLERYVSLAPLHQPNNLAPIRTLLTRRPELPQIACFDTAFHRSHGALADHYALPDTLYKEGVRRYGFHGLSYEYIAQRLPQVAPEIAKGRVIVAHLGSGASMCALANGRSVESTLGFTALDGLPMGTRPGQLDPGVVLYLIAEKGMSPSEVEDLFYRQSGLKGLSGVSNDVRELEKSTSPKAAFALEYFVYRAGLFAGMLAAALSGFDAFVFTAGIGENSPTMRARISDKLAWLGVVIDTSANAAGKPLISSKDSRVAVYVIPTNEELMIARHTLALLTAEQGASIKSVAKL
jgi:acetate kinase